MYLHYSAFKMEAAGSSDTLVMSYQPTWSHIPEDSNFHCYHSKHPNVIFKKNDHLCVAFSYISNMLISHGCAHGLMGSQ
jgi:hypothetical protein